MNIWVLIGNWFGSALDPFPVIFAVIVVLLTANKSKISRRSVIILSSIVYGLFSTVLRSLAVYGTISHMNPIAFLFGVTILLFWIGVVIFIRMVINKFKQQQDEH